MSGQIQHYGEDSFVRCYLCGADAAGPCMSCRKSVCGDCCVLIDGKASKWAVCTRCEKKGSAKVGGWGGLALFFAKLIVVLLVLIFFFAWLAGKSG